MSYCSFVLCSDDGRRSGIADDQQANINYAGSIHYLQNTGNEVSDFFL